MYILLYFQSNLVYYVWISILFLCRKNLIKCCSYSVRPAVEVRNFMSWELSIEAWFSWSSNGSPALENVTPCGCLNIPDVSSKNGTFVFQCWGNLRIKKHEVWLSNKQKFKSYVALNTLILQQKDQSFNTVWKIIIVASEKHNYLLSYLLTPWSRGVLLEELTGFQLVQKFPAFYATRRFIKFYSRWHVGDVKRAP